MDVWVVEEYYWNEEYVVSSISGIFSNETAAKKFVSVQG